MGCFVCGAVPSQSDGTTGQESKLYCGQCKFYCYCSRQCQTEHWVNLGHKGECKHLGLLKKYHEPYARDIRDAFVYKGKKKQESGKIHQGSSSSSYYRSAEYYCSGIR